MHVRSEKRERDHSDRLPRRASGVRATGQGPRPGLMLGDAKMCKRWVGVALLVGWLSWSNTASAQYLPQAGVPPIPEPVPFSGVGPLSPQQATPGPMRGDTAPLGPSQDLGLPPGVPGAFPCEDCPIPDYWFFHAGATALQRQRLGHGIFAFTDTADTSRLDTGNQVGRHSFSAVNDLNNIVPRMAWGAEGTIGYMMGNFAVELSGLYIPEASQQVSSAYPGRLNSGFVNAPLGFTGNNGLWQQADVISATFSSRVANGELNFRWFSQAQTGMEVLIGIRYMDYLERLVINTDDDGLTFRDNIDRPDPRRQASYTSRTLNRIVGPQIGFERQESICQGIALGAFGKAAGGLNIANVDIQLQRGDGLLGLTGGRSRLNLSSILEAGVYFDAYWLERLRVRAGYHVMGLINVLEAVDQVDYNLSNQTGRQDNTGFIFFHGPSIELQFLF